MFWKTRQASARKRHWNSVFDSYRLSPEASYTRTSLVDDCDDREDWPDHSAALSSASGTSQAHARGATGDVLSRLSRQELVELLRSKAADDIQWILKDLAYDFQAIFEKVLGEVDGGFDARMGGAAVRRSEDTLCSHCRGSGVQSGRRKDASPGDVSQHTDEVDDAPCAVALSGHRQVDTGYPMPTCITRRRRASALNFLPEDREVTNPVALDDVPEDAPAIVLSRSKLKESLQARSRPAAPQETRQLQAPLVEQDGTKDSSSEPPLIHFSCKEYYCSEGSLFVTVEVVRLGCLDHPSEVRFKTVDHTGMEGQGYEALRGTLRFEPGVYEQQIFISLVDDDVWNPLVEFFVQLLPHGLVNAQLDSFLSRATVIVDDNDAFPTNKYRDQLQAVLDEGVDLSSVQLHSIPATGLFVQFCKKLVQGSEIRCGVIKSLILDQLHNAYNMQKLFMSFILVDRILSDGSATKVDVLTHLLVYISMLIVPFILLHYLDYIRPTWRVAGLARKTIQTAMLRKFLNFRIEDRINMNHGALIMAVTRDTTTVIDKGFLAAFQLLQAVSSCVWMLLYQVIFAVYLDKPMPFDVIGPMLIYPVVIALFLCCRQHWTTAALSELIREQDQLIDMVDGIASSSQLIIDYNVRDRFLDMYDRAISMFNKQAIHTGQVILNNSTFVGWLSLLLASGYTVFAGSKVVAGTYALATFLVNLQMFDKIGLAWASVYAIACHIGACFPNIERIVVLMNYPLDISQRVALLGHNRRLTRQLRADARKEVRDASMMSIDCLPLRIPLGLNIDDGHLDLDQGSLIYILGPHGEGKSMLLRTLAGVVLPDDLESESFVFVPPHLRSVYVSNEPVFFKGTLRDNLSIGLINDNEAGHVARFIFILKKLGMPVDILEQLEKDDEDWLRHLSVTQRHLLSLGRALIANPELLCISKALQFFDQFTTSQVLKLLRAFVDNRGVAVDAIHSGRRRPRTCIVSSNHRLDGKLADQVVHVSLENGMRLLKKSRRQNDTRLDSALFSVDLEGVASSKSTAFACAASDEDEVYELYGVHSAL